MMTTKMTTAAPSSSSSMNLLMMQLMVLLCLLLLSLGIPVVESVYVEPEWYEKMSTELDGTERVRRCYKRKIAPVHGTSCTKRKKTCFFQTQVCPDGTPYPIIKCHCTGMPNRTWACNTMSCPATSTSTPRTTGSSGTGPLTLEANDMGPSNGYTGSSNPTAGSVKVKFLPDDVMEISYDITGLPPICLECKMHIQQGTTCSSTNQNVDYHYNNVLLSENPWLVDTSSATYSSNANGDARGYFHIFSGKSYTETVGHAFVVMDANGSPISCGKLMTRDLQLESHHISTYNTNGDPVIRDLMVAPSDSQTVHPSGSVKVTFMDNDVDTMLVSYDLDGLEPNCVNCGIRIYSGTTCNAEIGTSYYDQSEQATDPWSSIFGATYNTGSTGKSKGSFTLFSGYNYTETAGHAVGILASDGSLLACGLLLSRDDTLESDNIHKHPGYAGSLTPTGSVNVKFLPDDSMIIAYSMTGLPPLCDECGFHIHSGSSCEATHLVGGHHWDRAISTNDIWWAPANRAYYSTDANGEGKGFYRLYSGYNYTKNVNHTVVFHDQVGMTIGCGTLE